jgi:hypothetical protein
MCKLVKHHEQFADARQLAVDGDKMPSLYAVIKAVRRQGHLDDRYLEPLAEAIKIVFAERSLIPLDTQALYFFEV